jgi:hypothetical protein
MNNSIEVRPAIIEKYLALASCVNAFNLNNLENKQFYTRDDISLWVIEQCEKENEELGFFEINELTSKIHAIANKVKWLGQDKLTAGELRQKLDEVAPNTVIAYQRIEDSFFQPGKGWKETSASLAWETHKIRNEEQKKWFEDNPSDDYRLKEINGELFWEDLSDYIPAFSAWLTADDEGNHVFVINAHY